MTHDGRNGRPDEPTGAGQSETLLERQLDALIEELEIEQAPPSLTRRLYRIPHEEQGREAWWRRWLPTGAAPRWVLVPALAAGVLALGVALLLPRQPSPEEVFQARQDLAVAFSYIDKAGVLTGREIQSVLGGELHHAVKDNLSKSIPFTEQFRKEETT
jgi:hypothetical protein